MVQNRHYDAKNCTVEPGNYQNNHYYKLKVKYRQIVSGLKVLKGIIYTMKNYRKNFQFIIEVNFSRNLSFLQKNCH